MTLRGMSTVTYFAADLPAAARWYTELLGVEPYLRRDASGGRPALVEFRIGDYRHEMGIMERGAMGFDGDAAGAETPQPGGAAVFWHVDDIHATVERLHAMGARVHMPPTPFGEEFIGALVIDPFGNILGVMQNPHYLEVLAARGG